MALCTQVCVTRDRLVACVQTLEHLYTRVLSVHVCTHAMLLVCYGRLRVLRTHEKMCIKQVQWFSCYLYLLLIEGSTFQCVCVTLCSATSQIFCNYNDIICSSIYTEHVLYTLSACMYVRLI